MCVDDCACVWYVWAYIDVHKSKKVQYLSVYVPICDILEYLHLQGGMAHSENRMCIWETIRLVLWVCQTCECSQICESMIIRVWIWRGKDHMWWSFLTQPKQNEFVQIWSTTYYLSHVTKTFQCLLSSFWVDRSIAIMFGWSQVWICVYPILLLQIFRIFLELSDRFFSSHCWKRCRYRNCGNCFQYLTLPSSCQI